MSTCYFCEREVCACDWSRTQWMVVFAISVNYNVRPNRTIAQSAYVDPRTYYANSYDAWLRDNGWPPRLPRERPLDALRDELRKSVQAAQQQFIQPRPLDRIVYGQMLDDLTVRLSQVITPVSLFNARFTTSIV